MSAQLQVSVSAEPLLSRLDGVMKSGRGWRARCPGHKSRERSLTIAEADDRVLIHCFAGCRAVEVLEAVGMTWADIQPPKHWPQTREEKRQAARAIREAGLLAAFDSIYREAQVLEVAGLAMGAGLVLNAADQARLRKAVTVVSDAYIALRDFDFWQRREGRA